MDNSRIVIPTRPDPDETTSRSHGVITTPRRNGVFPGWGVRF